MSAEVENVVPLKPKAKRKRATPSSDAPTRDREAIYLAMEDHVCQLATAA